MAIRTSDLFLPNEWLGWKGGGEWEISKWVGSA